MPGSVGRNGELSKRNIEKLPLADLISASLEESTTNSSISCDDERNGGFLVKKQVDAQKPDRV